MTNPNNHPTPTPAASGGQNIYNARNTTPGKAFSIAQQWQPPALQNAVLRLSAMARPPNTGINLDTLRQQVQTRMNTILQMHNDRLRGIYTPGSPFKSPKPIPPPAPIDPAHGRGTVYPKVPQMSEGMPSKVRDTNWYANNAGTRPPTPNIVPQFDIPPTPKGL